MKKFFSYTAFVGCLFFVCSVSAEQVQISTHNDESLSAQSALSYAVSDLREAAANSLTLDRHVRNSVYIFAEDVFNYEACMANSYGPCGGYYDLMHRSYRVLLRKLDYTKYTHPFVHRAWDRVRDLMY